MLLGGFPFGIPSRASACGQKVCSFCAPALSSQSVLPEGWYRSYLLRPPSPASYPWSAKDMGEGAAAAGRDLSVLSELDRLNGGVGRFFREVGCRPLHRPSSVYSGWSPLQISLCCAPTQQGGSARGAFGLAFPLPGIGSGFDHGGFER